ncbi:hypothetical protein D3C72_1552950 [compost metagenome]
MQALQVQFGAITLVLIEAVFGIGRMQVHEGRVARRLGQDGGGGNRIDLVVATDDGHAAYRHHGAAVAVDQGQGRHGRQGLDGAAHGQHRRLQDVQAVDLFFRRFGDGPGQGLGLDLRCQQVAFRFAEFFRIAQAVDGLVRVEDHGGGEHGAGQRTAACLVDAADDFIEREWQVVKQAGIDIFHVESLVGTAIETVLTCGVRR